MKLLHYAVSSNLCHCILLRSESYPAAPCSQTPLVCDRFIDRLILGLCNINRNFNCHNLAEEHLSMKLSKEETNFTVQMIHTCMQEEKERYFNTFANGSLNPMVKHTETCV